MSHPSYKHCIVQILLPWVHTTHLQTETFWQINDRYELWINLYGINRAKETFFGGGTAVECSGVFLSTWVGRWTSQKITGRHKW